MTDHFMAGGNLARSGLDFLSLATVLPGGRWILTSLMCPIDMGELKITRNSMKCGN
jgi:hypothetical protein